MPARHDRKPGSNHLLEERSQDSEARAMLAGFRHVVGRTFSAARHGRRQGFGSYQASTGACRPRFVRRAVADQPSRMRTPMPTLSNRTRIYQVA